MGVGYRQINGLWRVRGTKAAGKKSAGGGFRKEGAEIRSARRSGSSGRLLPTRRLSARIRGTVRIYPGSVWEEQRSFGGNEFLI